MRHARVRAGLMPAVLLAAGCSLISANLRVQLDVPGNYASVDAIGTFVVPVPIDLNQNKDFRDHKDKIKSIDEVGFVFTAVNRGAATTLEIWASPNLILQPTRAAITENARKVLGGLTLAAPPQGSTTSSQDVEYYQSIDLQSGADSARLRELVKEGSCYLYAIGTTSGFDFELRGFTLVTVVTAAL